MSVFFILTFSKTVPVMHVVGVGLMTALELDLLVEFR